MRFPSTALFALVLVASACGSGDETGRNEGADASPEVSMKDSNESSHESEGREAARPDAPNEDQDEERVRQGVARNRLANETSPYLLQHADNHVDWYPWGSEALELAKRSDKPILLSIGYSACHWCHVMEHESFENEEIAALMNQHFVNIKVDREERPDIDEIYMKSVQMMGVGGGWPLTVFLTPELEPFYGGTYFPPQDQFGRPGFPRVLISVADAYRNRRDQVEKTAGQLVEALNDRIFESSSVEELSIELLSGAASWYRSRFDPEYGGFGNQPKFPQAMDLSLLLRLHRRTEDEEALLMVRRTLDMMSRGGIYDHLGGGFHRYSTDRRWLVPHFEKMLYDNALLTRTLLEAYQITGEEGYAEVARESLDYVLREMTHPGGGFYSTQDADSEGEEGKFFVWTFEEIEAVLGRREATIFCDFYGVTEGGNFENGKSILHAAREPEDVAAGLDLEVSDLEEILRSGRRRLFVVRSQRVWPGKDDKILTAWNGLMIATMARAHRVLAEDRYLEAAIQAAAFIFAECYRDGRLLRTHRGGVSKLSAYLEDYAYMTEGLLELFEATFDPNYLERALALTEVLERHFRDQTGGGYYFTPDDHEELITRTKNMMEASTPAGNAVAALNSMKLWKWTGEDRYRDRAEEILRNYVSIMRQAPGAAGTALMALDFYVDGGREIAVVGTLEEPSTRLLLRAVNQCFLPNTILMAMPPGEPVVLDGKILPMLEGKEMMDGKPSAFVCRNYTCRFPVTTPEELLSLLDG